MLTGLSAPLTALQFLLKNKGLIKYLVIPFLLNAVFFSLFIYFTFHGLSDLIQSFLPESEGSLALRAYYFLTALSLAVLLLISVICFSIVGTIITAPFTDLLTQQVEAKVLGISTGEGDFSIASLMKIPRGLWEEFKRICFVALIFACLSPMNFIPLAGQIVYAFLGGLVLLLFLGLEFFSFSLDRRDYSFKRKMGFMKERFFDVLGVGISAWILLLIPIVNFAILPLTAVGATLCFCGYTKFDGKGI